MAAMTGDEFRTKVTTEHIETDPDAESWAVRAGSVLSVIALSHETASKESLVEAIQEIAMRMPPELVLASTLQIMRVQNGL